MEEHLTNLIINVVDVFGNMGPIIGTLLIVAESILPILPLSIFIALNVLAFGFLLGFIISYIATVIGCMAAFIIVRKGFKSKFYEHAKEGSRVNNFMKKISKLKFSSFVLIIAMPFTPAFVVNICAALSGMKIKKFLASILIGKLAIVYFWGFIGDSLLESITNPIVLLKIIVLLIITYILSRIIDKKFGIE